MMKKLFLAIVLAAISTTGAFAQFEKGKIYGGASVSGFDMSYSETTKFSLGVDAALGKMIAQDWLIIAELGYQYHNSETQTFSVGAKGRYYIEQNGIFLSLGAKFQHMFKDYNDFFLTPEVGYCWFLNHNVMLEPSVYYNMSLSDFGDKSRFGVKIGIGFFF